MTSTTAQAADAFIAQAQRPQITADVYDLHIFLLVSVLVVFCVVFGIVMYTGYRHRKGLGHTGTPFHPSAYVEAAWALIPFIIVLITVWPATRMMIGMRDTSNAYITIKATGMQWKWGYSYLAGEGAGISFFANLVAGPTRPVVLAGFKNNDYAVDVDHPLVVPVNKKIRIVFSASDAIHSWHIPALGVRQDAIPGLARDTWFNARKIGSYRGLCSLEACGPGRACLLIVVHVVSDDDYRKWVRDWSG